MVNYVAQNPDAIGFVGLGYVSNDSDVATGSFITKVKVAAIHNDSTSEFLKPYQAYIALRTYPLARNLYFIKNEEYLGLATGFSTFLSNQRGQLIFSPRAHVPAAQRNDHPGCLAQSQSLPASKNFVTLNTNQRPYHNPGIHEKNHFFLLAGAALTIVVAHAQSSLDDGIKMVKYQRYTSAEKNSAAVSCKSQCELLSRPGAARRRQRGRRKSHVSLNIPTTRQNMAGMARIAFLDGKPDEGLRIAQSVSDKAKKKDWQPIVYAADAINYGGGSPQAAIDLYKKALTHGDNVDVRIGLGDASQKLQGGGGEAMNNYENATTQDAKKLARLFAHRQAVV